MKTLALQAETLQTRLEHKFCASFVVFFTFVLRYAATMSPMKIRYPKVREFECEWLSDLVRAYPVVRRMMLPVNAIRRNVYDRGQRVSRRASFRAEVDALVEAIKASDTLDAILVAPHVDGNLVCCDGHHRLAACRQMGMKRIPAVALSTREADARQVTKC